MPPGVLRCVQGPGEAVGGGTATAKVGEMRGETKGIVERNGGWPPGYGHFWYIFGIMWLKQCHKPSITGNGKHTTYNKNGDDWGMVQMALLNPHIISVDDSDQK